MTSNGIKPVNNVNFKGAFYNGTAYVQEHTLLNRGLIDLGGSAIPHTLLSNTKEEAIERASMGALYFSLSFFTPILLLPLYNKHFLKSNGIIKDFANKKELKIIEVSKKYLTKDNDAMVKGIRETGKKLNCEKEFEGILNRFKNKDELREKLLKTHESVLRTDFLSTAWMWCATPWIVTEISEAKTHRKGFSATFNMKDDSDIDDKTYKRNKHLKMLGSAIFATVPGLIVPKLVTKGLKGNSSNKILSFINKNPEKFDYAFSVNMSKTLFASMWLLSSYPSKIISSRDGNERKDRACRDGSLLAMYFLGDHLISNIVGRSIDKISGTKIMNDDKFKGKKPNFFEKLTLSIRDFKEIEKMPDISKETLRKTKNAGAAAYWAGMLSNMALIGITLPKIMNWMLKKNVNKELAEKGTGTDNFNTPDINKFMKKETI